MRRLLAWIQGFAESLGGPGLFVIAYLDSSFLSFPQVCDALIVLLTVRHPERMLFYALITTLGSVAGCYSLYLVGRKGGESFLRKRFHERHVDRALDVFRRHGILSVLVPSLMPPPMPFKIFVLAAGVSGMSTFDFLVAVATRTRDALLRHRPAGASGRGSRRWRGFSRTRGRPAWRSRPLSWSARRSTSGGRAGSVGGA